MFYGKLYAAQIEGAEYLVNRRKVLLGYEQGTGKTVISIAAIEKLFQLGKVKKVLIVGPSAFIWQWEDEYRKFTDREPVYVTRKNEEARKYNVGDGEVWIVSYHLFRRDIEKILRVDWDVLVADEAEEISNPRGVTRKLFLRLNRETNAFYRWALTGTGVAKRLEQLYSILYWVDKYFLPPWPEFEERHIIRDKFGRIATYDNLISLNVYIQKRVSRKTHKDMKGKLPKILPKVITLPKGKEYKKAENDLVLKLNEMVEKIQFNSDGEIVGAQRDSAVSKAFHRAELEVLLAKIPFTVNFLQKIYDENPENKQVVFSRLKEPLYKMHQELAIPSFYFTGDQKSEEKRENITKFKEEGGILLASNAGARGLNLPFANYVTNFDVPKSFAIGDQRAKRIVRASSKFQSVVVNYLITEYSIENYFYEQMLREGELHSAVFEGTADTVEIKPESLRQYLTQ